MDLDTRYKFLEKIGAGSFATVYRALDRELGREVAIKQIHEQYLDDPDLLTRYWQEAQLLASLHHPNIVTIFDIHRDRGWLILELMQANLAERMAGRQMDLRALRSTLAHCLRALRYLHERGIVHGDVKPSNMMIDARRRVKLGDFGLARRVSDEEGSLLKGTTKYMAPETVSAEFGEVGPQSDLYSLGFSAYELMCGTNFESLFPGLSAFGRNKQIAWMMWHAAADRKLPEIPQVLEGVPDDLAHVIQQLCEKDQASRYRSAEQALSDLNIDVKIIDRPSDSETSEPQDETHDAHRRQRLLLAGGALAASLILSLVLLFVPSGGSGLPDQPQTKVRIVSEVYPDKHRVKVEDPHGTFAEEISLGQTPRIYLQNTRQNIVLRELKPGDRIEIEEKRTADGKTVVYVTAARPVASRGRIRTIDPQSSRLVVAVEEGRIRDDLQLRVADRAEILLNAKPVPLDELREGDRVEVRHLPELGEKGGRVAERISVQRLREAVGFVADVDPDGLRMTIRFGKSDVSAGSLTLSVAEDCTVTLRRGSQPNASDVPLTELRPDDRVRVGYDVEFRKIEVTRDQQQTAGVVQEVRSEPKQVVISTADGQRLTVRVGESCEVTLSLEPASLDDLRQYDKAEITYDESESGELTASTVFATRPLQHDRWAIIIAPDRYDSSFLTYLPYAGRDADLFRDTLVKRYAFAEDRLLMERGDSPQTMQKDVADYLQQARTQTQVLVYVTGHAYLGEDNRVYLAGRHFNWDRMSDTGLPLDWLIEQLEACSAEDKILFLDCSHEGRGRDLTRQPSTAEMLQTLSVRLKSTAVIASCRAGQRGLDWDEKRHGVFAWFLAEGFAGPADRNRDLRITANEISQYLRDRMSQLSLPGGRSQTPVLVLPRKQ